jgi:hypothetical protein
MQFPAIRFPSRRNTIHTAQITESAGKLIISSSSSRRPENHQLSTEDGYTRERKVRSRFMHDKLSIHACPAAFFSREFADGLDTFVV